jgi:hypothetical protein
LAKAQGEVEEKEHVIFNSRTCMTSRCLFGKAQLVDRRAAQGEGKRNEVRMPLRRE